MTKRGLVLPISLSFIAVLLSVTAGAAVPRKAPVTPSAVMIGPDATTVTTTNHYQEYRQATTACNVGSCTLNFKAVRDSHTAQVTALSCFFDDDNANFGFGALYILDGTDTITFTQILAPAWDPGSGRIWVSQPIDVVIPAGSHAQVYIQAGGPNPISAVASLQCTITGTVSSTK